MIEKSFKRDWRHVRAAAVRDFIVSVEEDRAGWPEDHGLGGSDVNCLMCSALNVCHDELDDIPFDVWQSWRSLFHRAWEDEFAYVALSNAVKPDMLPGVEIDMN